MIFLQNRNAVVENTKLWPGGIVPYEKDPGLEKNVCMLL